MVSPSACEIRLYLAGQSPVKMSLTKNKKKLLPCSFIYVLKKKKAEAIWKKTQQTCRSGNQGIA